MENTTNTSVLKVGVLTFHRCINYGSYWQARCLAEGIQALGHNVVILDHDSHRVNLLEWTCAFQPVLPTSVPKSDYPLYREKILKFFRIFDSLPLSKRFDLENPDHMENYDVVVVGSDEVWNLSHPWFGGCSLFYGDGLKAKRLVSYAASFGNYDATWGMEPAWAEKLRNFNNISVRDANSQAIIKNALGFEPEMVLDPCLQFPVHPDARPLNHLQKPYIAVYGHNFTESFASEIRHYANKKGLPLISIGYRNDWADEQWLTADPHDFANFMAQAEAVVTNFFHGCVFALRNAKPFVCETTPYRRYKLQGLMAKIGGEHHLIPEGTPAQVYEARLSEPLNPEILQKINQLRQTSNAYLDSALGTKQLQFA
ncbi:polysaccharide pyruvyl transferase family protein [Adhaeribacter radiodurans]|uniref:Polysaccharide pyruvyl transferase family protein n=1 Tax=Adhaeribacter radiodurans TaxID=2745197 RepID=A0A7L7L8Q0_9BACT|nr:polysaccharide pyruvyl transferase family protein [Adhaeribacter radiodurans]QMU29206.1 polysaccharide pyruvyl transferase family protein [Adhaeribacter radiodurans]